jgi:hypothetical protein
LNLLDEEDVDFITINVYAKEALTEAVDKELQAKLDAHNEYIKFLQEEIEKEEKALEAAKNDFIKEAIQRRLDALKEDLEKALPEEVKNDTVEEAPVEETIEDEIQEEPTEEIVAVEEEPIEEKEEEVKESLKETVDTDLDDAIEARFLGVTHVGPKMSDLTPEEQKIIKSGNKEEIKKIVAKYKKEETKESLAESLTEDTANKDLTDAEFKELMANLSKNESVEEDFDLDLLEEIDEKVLAKAAFKNLKENTKNLTAIKITNCEIKDSKLVLEGKIKVANEVKPLKYICENFKIVDNENIKADCLAECLDNTKQCVVNGNIKNNILNITKIKNN